MCLLQHVSLIWNQIYERNSSKKIKKNHQKNSIPLRFSFSQLHTVSQILIPRISNATRLQLLFPLLQHTRNKTQQRNTKIFAHSLISKETNNQIPIKEKGTRQLKITKRNMNSWFNYDFQHIYIRVSIQIKRTGETEDDGADYEYQ